MFSSKINMKNTCVMMHFAKFGCQLTFTNWFSKDENVKFRSDNNNSSLEPLSVAVRSSYQNLFMQTQYNQMHAHYPHARCIKYN